MVKKHPPERDPEGFAEVRAAYEAAQAQLTFGVAVATVEAAAERQHDGEGATTDEDAPDGDSAASQPGPDGAIDEREATERVEPVSLEAWIAEDEARRRAMLEQVEELVARFEDDPEGVTHEVLELVHQGEGLGHDAAERLVFVAAWSGVTLDPELERVAHADRTMVVYAQRLGGEASATWPKLPPVVRRLLSCPPGMVFETRQVLARQAKAEPEAFLRGLLRVDHASGAAVDYLALLLGIGPLGAEPNAYGVAPDTVPDDVRASLEAATGTPPGYLWLVLALMAQLVCAVPFAAFVILNDAWSASWLFPYVFALVVTTVVLFITINRHYRRVVRPALVRFILNEGIHPRTVVAWGEADGRRSLAIFVSDIKADPFLTLTAAVVGVLVTSEGDDDPWLDGEDEGFEDEDGFEDEGFEADDGDGFDDEGFDDEGGFEDDDDLGPRAHRERARRRRSRRKGDR